MTRRWWCERYRTGARVSAAGPERASVGCLLESAS